MYIGLFLLRLQQMIDNLSINMIVSDVILIGSHSFSCLISYDFIKSFFCFTDFLISAAVSEFKGPHIFGVVRLAQVNMELARIEANFSGLSPGKHGWSINEFGDLTRGAASTGKLFNLTSEESTKEVCFSVYLLDDFYYIIKILVLRIGDWYKRY